MGFPVAYTDIFLPKLFFKTLSILSFIKTIVLSLFRFLGFFDILEINQNSPDFAFNPEIRPPLSALLIREILPVIKFEELTNSDEELPERCAVCLYEFEGEEEIRSLRNCRHVFHRGCIDRWMDYDQMTCPLCRTAFVPDEMQNEFNRRLWADSAVDDLHSDEDCPVTELL